LYVAALFVTSVAVLAAAAQSPPRTIWDGVYTTEQAKRGQATYAAQCSACHGALLEGIDAAPSLAGGWFMSHWDSVSLSDMTDRVRVSMPLSSPGSLSRQQVVDVLSYILSANGLPPGDTELPAQAARLSQILFRASKPGSH
jgi:mono/diheme cytochrome c family protein